MRRNTNWGYLPDYSHQNHTLRFARKSRNSDSYERPDDRIPPVAYVGIAVVVAAFFAVFALGTAAGF
jgi:hypothetical protein